MRLRRLLQGSEKGADVFAVQRALGTVENDFLPKPYTSVYDRRTQQAVRTFQHVSELGVDGVFGQQTLNELTPYFDRYGRWKYRYGRIPKPKSRVPNLGPVYPGGASILFHSLTHETEGFPNAQHPQSCYPAFDDGWRAGRAVLAPEDLIVTAQSGSLGGDAFYATGKSKLEYWFAHLAYAPRTGRRFKKGETMGVIANIPLSQGSPHVHTGINAWSLLGREFEHKTNYQTGAPSVGEQLTRALV